MAAEIDDKHNGQWAAFEPRTNVLWAQNVAKRLLERVHAGSDRTQAVIFMKEIIKQCQEAKMTSDIIFPTVVVVSDEPTKEYTGEIIQGLGASGKLGTTCYEC